MARWKAPRKYRPHAETRRAVDLLRFLEVYWPDDRFWYCCEVIDYVSADKTHLLEYVWDGEQEYLDLETNDWRLSSSEAKP